jgi:hypothetical protein
VGSRRIPPAGPNAIRGPPPFAGPNSLILYKSALPSLSTLTLAQRPLPPSPPTATSAAHLPLLSLLRHQQSPGLLSWLLSSPLCSPLTGHVRRGGGARNGGAFPIGGWPATLPPSLRRANPHRWARLPLHPVADPAARGFRSSGRLHPVADLAGVTSSSSSGGSDGRGFGGGKISGRRSLHSHSFPLSLSDLVGGCGCVLPSLSQIQLVVVVLVATAGGGG